MATLQVVAAVLWLTRRWTPGRPTARALLMLAVSIAASSAILVLAADQRSWPIVAELAFALGTCVAVLSLLALGQSFTIAPACRAIVRRGPYRLVRHPAYAGELIMIASAAGVVASRGRGSQVLLASVAAAALLLGVWWRITREEHCLAGAAGWQDYTRTVRFRLLPGLW